jgi:hypothetical protein
MSHHLVGIAEISHMMKVTPQRVIQIVAAYEDFPEPEAELAAGRVWKTADVKDWLAKHKNRKPGRPRKAGGIAR